jgi:hypothetical protein
MLNFVTLFNSNYLSRGLVLYESLDAQCDVFHLYVIAFDDSTLNYLKNNSKPHLTVISLKQFEDEKLLAIKNTRSATEYCWTCTPSTVAYCIQTFQLDHCVYLDADMCFYSNPKSLFEEWGHHSVLITEHRYTAIYDQSKTSGIYCVQFVGFKNDPSGMEVLEYWRNACIDWCYARVENGKFGDQKYLDDWTTKFKNVHVLQHLGGGIAPWNVQQYDFINENNKIIGTERSSKKIFESIFFHFHGLKFFENDIVSLTNASYAIDKNTMNLFYFPYIKWLNKIKQEIYKNDKSINANGASQKSPYKPIGFKTIVQYYIAGVKNSKRHLLGLSLLKKIKHHYYFNSTKI